MTDNYKNKYFRNLGLEPAILSQFKEFNCEEELTSIQARLYFLMINGAVIRSENESLYGWCGRIGLSNSTIFGIFKKNNRTMHSSVADKIAEVTGANPEWIRHGIGEPFEQQTQTAQVVEPVQEQHILDTSLLQQAFETLDQALSATNKVMAPEGRSKFVATVYASLKEQESLNTEVLEDCIFTIEEALKSTRRVMSPKAKTDLILVIYDLYSGEASYKEAMKSTINQLIRSVS